MSGSLRVTKAPMNVNAKLGKEEADAVFELIGSDERP